MFVTSMLKNNNAIGHVVFEAVGNWLGNTPDDVTEMSTSYRRRDREAGNFVSINGVPCEGVLHNYVTQVRLASAGFIYRPPGDPRSRFFSDVFMAGKAVVNREKPSTENFHYTQRLLTVYEVRIVYGILCGAWPGSASGKKVSGRKKGRKKIHRDFSDSLKAFMGEWSLNLESLEGEREMLRQTLTRIEDMHKVYQARRPEETGRKPSRMGRLKGDDYVYFYMTEVEL